MARLAVDRTTHLTRPEIVTEALRQFDAGPGEPSIRSLAGELRVAPAAIYHHFPSQAAIWQGAVARVWDEALVELLRLIPDPFSADPVEALVAAGLATRRAWFAHHRLARYMAATPGAEQWRSNTISLLASLFERLGVSGEDAGVAFHCYATFMLGAVLYAAANKTANEQLVTDADDPTARIGSHPEVVWTEYSSDATRRAMESVTDYSIVEPLRDEEYFVYGLRRLILSLTTEGSERRRQPKRTEAAQKTRRTPGRTS